MAVASGNDASVAVAEYIAGSRHSFVQRMNALAKRLGMSRSHFVNVNGLPASGQITTARDMMKLARAYEAHYPSARRYHLSPSVTYRGKTEPNHNPLVSWYPGINGLKTGWITAAGYNIIATASRRGHKLIAVVLGAPNTRVRAAEAGRLLNAGFAAIGKKGGNAAAELGISSKQAASLKKSPAYAKPMTYTPPLKKNKKQTASHKARSPRQSSAAHAKQSPSPKTAPRKADGKQKPFLPKNNTPSKEKLPKTSAASSQDQSAKLQTQQVKNASPPAMRSGRPSAQSQAQMPAAAPQPSAAKQAKPTPKTSPPAILDKAPSPTRQASKTTQVLQSTGRVSNTAQPKRK